MAKRIISLLLFSVILLSAFTDYSISASAIPPKADWTPAITKSAQKKLDLRVEELIGDIPKEMKSNYQKALYAYIRFCENLSYNMNEKEGSTAYGAIVNGWAQCEGMANGYAYLLTKLNVPVKVVVSRSAMHVWNLVQMDNGKWYHVDFVPKGEVLFAGNKTLYKYHGDICDDYYACDGSELIRAVQNDYTGGTKAFGTTTSLHQKVQDDGVYIADGWFYYSVENKFTQEQQEKYNKYSSQTYKTLRRTRGNTDELLLDWDDLNNVTPAADGFDVIDACGNNLYYFNCNNACYGKITACYKFDTLTKSLTYEGEKSIDTYIGDKSKINMYNYTHSVEKLPLATAYGKFRTKNRIVCSDCKKMLYSGRRIKPSKITVSPKFTLSNKNKGKFTVSFVNKFYKETCQIEWFKSCGGYEIAYRLKGKKRWNYADYFSGRKNIAKSLKVYKKGKYEVKLRFFVTYGTTYYYYKRINHYGPWSKIKTVRVKK